MLWRKGFDILLTECCDERDLIFYEQNVVWWKGFDILLTECCDERDLIFY